MYIHIWLYMFQSVKSIKPFKAKRKRGGRFGLKRLKEKKSREEELEREGSPSRLDPSDVDVKFSLPKFKQRTDGKSAVEGAGGAVASVKTKRGIRLVVFVLSCIVCLLMHLLTVNAIHSILYSMRF